MSLQLSLDFSQPLASPVGNTLLPIRPRPQPDEILSSWLGRIALANGLSPRQLSRHLIGTEHLIEREIDRLPPAGLIRILSEHSGIPEDDLSEMRLTAETAYLEETLIEQGTPAHIVCHGYQGAENGVSRGTPFCPDCLGEDQDPYFRRSWRYSFVTACAKHRRLLVDHCQGCHEPLVFFRPATVGGTRFERAHLGICQRCGTDNASITSHTPIDPLMEQLLPFQGQLLDGIKNRWINVIPEKPIHAVPWFRGLKLILRFLNLGSTSETWLSKATVGTQLAFKVDAFLYRPCSPFTYPDVVLPIKWDRAETMFEHRTIRARAYGLLIACALLANWPSSMHESLRGDSVAQADWRSLLRLDAPFWIREGLWGALAEPFRSLSNGYKASCRAYLASMGYTRLKLREIEAFSYTGVLPKHTDEERLASWKRHLAESKRWLGTSPALQNGRVGA